MSGSFQRLRAGKKTPSPVRATRRAFTSPARRKERPRLDRAPINRLRHALLLGGLGLAVIAAAVVGVLRASRDNSAPAGSPSRSPAVAAADGNVVPRADLEASQQAARSAAATLRAVLDSDSEAAALMEARQLPGVGRRFHAFRSAFDELASRNLKIGERYIRRDPYLALEISADSASSSRWVWFERTTGGDYRVDLDSLIGTSDDAWAALDDRPGESFLLRGHARLVRGLDPSEPERLELTHPAAGHSLTVLVSEPALLPGGSGDRLRAGSVRVTMLARRLDSPEAGCQWRLERFLGHEWFVPIDRRG